MFLGRKNQYCENECTTKCNLQIQCDPYQITNDIFDRTNTKKKNICFSFTIHMETQKTPNRQSSLEKEELSWGKSTFVTSDYTQRYSHQDSMVVAQTQNYKPMEKDRKSRNKPMHLWVSYF